MSRQEIVLENSSRPELIKQGRKLECLTIAYNSLEGLIALVAGLVAGSIALVSFGFDSLIELRQEQPDYGGCTPTRMKGVGNGLKRSV